MSRLKRQIDKILQLLRRILGRSAIRGFVVRVFQKWACIATFLLIRALNIVRPVVKLRDISVNMINRAADATPFNYTCHAALGLLQERS